MKQLIQNLKTGLTSLEEIPVPTISGAQVLIKTRVSLISLGTEKMLVEFGKASLIQKARQQPERVQQVLDKIKTDGLLPTLETIFNKLDQPIPLGYCNVGTITEVGDEVTEFKVGDRVVSNGPHAEYVAVSKRLVARIPENVSDEDAAFTVIAAIGLEGLRLTEPTFGEVVVVAGLGLIGLLTAQLAKANGCRVIGFDLDPSKVNLAKSLGVDAFDASLADPAAYVKSLTDNRGADAVIITASAKNDDILHQSAEMSRKRGRIVLVGVVDLNLKRADFYEKELTFQVSCSYGPGRYDEQYEQKGIDYPISFARWTAQRNFESVLQAIAANQLKVNSLISDRTEFHEFDQVYNDLSNRSRIASVLLYPGNTSEPERRMVLSQQLTIDGPVRAAIMGAGNFTRMSLLPVLKKNKIPILAISSANGLSGTLLAKKYGIRSSTTDNSQIWNDQSVNLVIITTRHSTHANLTKSALQAGKHVFVEKPLALNADELKSIIREYSQKPGLLLHVGYNRRFSPHIEKIRSLIGDHPGPLHLVITMNAGFIPPTHWVQDVKEGGRIVGEACHLVDLAVFLTGSVVKSVSAQPMGVHPTSNTDNASFLLATENGSNVVINYFANGSKSFSKEKLELFYQNKTLVMDNFRVTTGFGWSGFSKLKTSQDKGHARQIEKIREALTVGKNSLIPLEQLINISMTTFAMIESLKSGNRVEVKTIMQDEN